MSNDPITFTRRQLTTLFSGALLGIVAEHAPAGAQAPVPAISAMEASPAAASGNAIDILIQDHRRIGALMTQIAATSAGDALQRAALLQRLADLLTIHNASEENLVYPAIRDLANRPQDAATLYHQQDEAKVLVFELDQMPKE